MIKNAFAKRGSARKFEECKVRKNDSKLVSIKDRTIYSGEVMNRTGNKQMYL